MTNNVDEKKHITRRLKNYSVRSFFRVPFNYNFLQIGRCVSLEFLLKFENNED